MSSLEEPAYRWVIVAASAVMLAFSMGLMVNGVSVFFIPLHEAFGWQRGPVSLINTAGLIGIGAGGIVMGRIADRCPIRKLCLFGATVLSVCVLLASLSTALWQLYLLFFLAGFLGAGSLFAPLIANTGNWFRYGVGLAIGITAAGQALGQGGVPLIAAMLIGEFGWRTALAILGGAMFCILVPLAILIRQPRVEFGMQAVNAQRIDDVSPVPLSTPVVVGWLSVAVVFCCICMSVPLMHLVPLIQDHGIVLEDAGSILFVMLLVAILGRICFGKLADSIGALPAYLIASAWQTSLVFGFVLLDKLEALYVLAVVYGFGYAGVMTSIIVCVRVMTPVARRASALGIVTTFGWLGHAIGGYQGGYFFDLTNGYILTFANAALAGLINLIIIGALFLTVTRRKTGRGQRPTRRPPSGLSVQPPIVIAQQG